MRLEDSVAFFTIHTVGEFTRQTYMGEFKVKCLLSPLEIMKADKLYRNLLGDRSEYSNEKARNFAFCLSQLQYRIIDSPPFWENKELGGGHIEDHNILSEVLDLAIEAENMYREQKEKDAKEIEERLTKAIKNKEIEKESEVEEIKSEDVEDEEDATEL